MFRDLQAMHVFAPFQAQQICIFVNNVDDVELKFRKMFFSSISSCFEHMLMKRQDICGEITGSPASATEPERHMIHCIACDRLIKYQNSWTYHRKTKYPESSVVEKNGDGNDHDVDHIDDAD